MKLQIIQLEPYDDVASVRDRLAFVRSERVLLVWPPTPPDARPLLCRKLDLVLVQREAARRGAWLALVSTHPDLLDLARDLNISVFPSVKASQLGEWKRPRSRVFTGRRDRPVDAPDPHMLMLRASRLRALSPRQRLVRRAVRLLVASVMVIALFSLVYLLVPGAEVIVSPTQAQLSTTLTLTAEPGLAYVDVERRRIPAERVQLIVEASATISTTGATTVPVSRATGAVLFTNRLESAVTIPAGTIVTTPGTSPTRFQTTDLVTVPAGVGQEVSVIIQATEEFAGTDGNIEANLIVNVDDSYLAGLVSVRNPYPTTGGSIREQSLVDTADYTEALSRARASVRQEALARISGRLSGTQIIVPDSIQLVDAGGEDVTYSAFVGDAQDTLTATMRAPVTALVVDEQSARQAALAQLSTEIPAGMRLLLESIVYTRGPLEVSATDVSLTISASGNAAVTIDPEHVRRRLAGLSVAAAREVLNREWLLDPRQPPEVRVWPPFLEQLPALSLRITVTVRP